MSSFFILSLAKNAKKSFRSQRTNIDLKNISASVHRIIEKTHQLRVIFQRFFKRLFEVAAKARKKEIFTVGRADRAIFALRRIYRRAEISRRRPRSAFIEADIQIAASAAEIVGNSTLGNSGLFHLIGGTQVFYKTNIEIKSFCQWTKLF